MRKVTYGGAVSLDGYFAGPGEAMDWLLWSDDVAAISAESWRGADTMLLGRKTYEFAVRHKHPLTQPGVRTVLFSHSLTKAHADVELVRGDAAAFVRELKSQEGGSVILMGGGELGASLIKAGLVDEIGFAVHPILLGGGIPALPPIQQRVELELAEARPIARGCVFLRYTIPR
jgi:dihydrofolate reductase